MLRSNLKTNLLAFLRLEESNQTIINDESSSIPSNTILDQDGQPILDQNGQFILAQ